MISKKINLLAIGFNYQEINCIQDELSKEFSHFNFDFAISVHDSWYRLNITDYDFILLDLTSSEINNIGALQKIFQKRDDITIIITVNSNDISKISNNVEINHHRVIIKDGNYTIKLVNLIKNGADHTKTTSNTKLTLNHKPHPIDNKLLEVLANDISDGIFFCDLEDNIVLLNQAAERLFEIDRGQLLGKSALEVPLGEGVHWLGKALQGAKLHIHITTTVKIQLKDKWLLLRFLPLYDGKNLYMGGFLYIFDLSSKKPFEEKQTGIEPDILSMIKYFPPKVVAEG